MFAVSANNKLTENETAKKFIRIPDEPKTLPWRLLQRAKERGKAWRTQASYNRAMVWNIFYLALMGFYIGAIFIKAQNEEFQLKKAEYDILSKGQKNEYDIAMKGMYEAIRTKQGLMNLTRIPEEIKFNVSYFISYEEKPYVFVTTEKEYTENKEENNERSIIGCGFVNPNLIAQWDFKENKTSVFMFKHWESEKEIEKTDHNCEFKPRTEPITSIVCAAYLSSEGPQESKNTVGICAFTGSGENNFNEHDRWYLQQRAIEFYNDFKTSIENKTVTPLAKRISDKNTPPANKL